MENNTSDNNQSTPTPTSLEEFWEAHKQDAMAYSVSRINPNFFGFGIPSVILYLGFDPISKTTVEEKFGGGTYAARVNKQDGGWDTRYEFMIPGDPKPAFAASPSQEPPESGVVFEEPRVVVPEQEESALQDAVEQLIPHLVTILRSIVDGRGSAEEECEDDEEPMPYAAPAIPEPFEYELLRKEAESREKETQQRSMRLGMSVGAALTAAGINAIAGDLIWHFARNIGIIGKSFGKTINRTRPFRQARPAYRSASDDGVNLAYGSPFWKKEESVKEPPIPDPDPDDKLPI